MQFKETKLADLFIVEPKPFIDNRGQFFRTYCKEEFSQIGHDKPFVQMNHSINTKKGTFRGFHFQAPPSNEAKLVRCIKGRVQDIIIDIRKNSPTFLVDIKVELSAENKLAVYIPAGFAHGFLTLEDDSQLLYHHTDFYEPKYEKGIRYTDPRLNVKFTEKLSVISDKDLNYSLLDNNFKGI